MELFDRIFEVKNNCVEDDKICKNCKSDLRIDEINGYWVCVNCGICTNIPFCVNSFSKNHSVIRPPPYTRSRYFKFFVERKKILPVNLEKRIILIFSEINTEFNKIVTDRRNFIKYSYLVRKILEIMGESEYFKYFPIPTRKRTLRKYDKIWRKICENLNYIFIPSL